MMVDYIDKIVTVYGEPIETVSLEKLIRAKRVAENTIQNYKRNSNEWINIMSGKRTLSVNEDHYKLINDLAQLEKEIRKREMREADRIATNYNYFIHRLIDALEKEYSIVSGRTALFTALGDTIAEYCVRKNDTES